jgi:MSHA biogenesis protein MshN
MSLINDVLRNLEANRPDALAAQNLQREIRSLPAVQPARWGMRLGLMMALVAAAGLAAWQFQEAASTPEQAPATAPSPVVAVSPLAASATAAVEPVESGTQLSENMKLAHELLSLPLVERPLLLEQSVAASVAPLAAPTPVAAVAKDTVEPPRSEASAAALRPVEPARIEKSPSVATARDRADVDWRRAEAAFSAGRADEGREALRAALRQDPSHVHARQAMLRHLLEVRRIDEAIVVLQEGLDLQPGQTSWAMSLARLHLEQGALAAADGVLARSQGFAENLADYAGFQGHLKTRLAQHRQAAAHYQRATRLAPNDGRWWLGLGLALESDGRLPESREALRRALASGNLPADLASVAEQHLR